MSSVFETTPGGAVKRILVADDEPEIRGYLEMALRCRGYSVETAPDGVEVLERLERGHDKVSLVLLDVLMPRKSGLDALRHIRLQDRQLPIIMLSCASSPATVVEAMTSGATDFLSKPISHEDLGCAVEKAFAKNLLPPVLIGAGDLAQESTALSFVPMKGLEP